MSTSDSVRNLPIAPPSYRQVERVVDDSHVRAIGTAPAWRRLHPRGALWGGARLTEIEREMARPETEAELSRIETAREYPASVVRRVMKLGASDFLAGETIDAADDGRRLTTQHIYALNAILSRVSGSLAITVGVNFLAMLPLWLEGSAAQLEAMSRRFRGGARAGLALTEIANGSDVLQNRTRAERGFVDERGRFHPGTGAASEGAPRYCITGEKQLINGAAQHEILVTFVRTAPVVSGDEADRRGFNFFVVPRDETLVSPRRWETLSCAAADISSVRFEGTLVPPENMLGTKGSGFALMLKTLNLSRGGVGAIASGALSRARDLAVAYSQKRRLYGAPIAQLAPLGDHLMRVEALDMLVAALATKTGAMINALGLGGAHFSAAAKFSCCVLAEEGVREGYRVVSVRALLRDDPYERILRDVLLYGAFEGTTHLMLDRLQARLIRLSRDERRREPAKVLADLRGFYGTRPRPMLEACRNPAPVYQVSPEDHAAALASVATTRPLGAIVALATALSELVRTVREDGRWDTLAGLPFELATIFSHLEALLALVELGDHGCRGALGLAPIAMDGHPHDLAYRFAIEWFGARLASELGQIARRLALPVGDALVAVEAALLDGNATTREAFRAVLMGQAASS